MFDKKIYQERRSSLKKKLKSGLVVFPGNNDIPFNSTGNTYPFRQDSSFLYFCGLDFPGLWLFLDIDENAEFITGKTKTLEDIIWSGGCNSLQETANLSGINRIIPPNKMHEIISSAVKNGREVHFLPQYRDDVRIQLSGMLDIPERKLDTRVSIDLIRAVSNLRSIKNREEILEIESAIDISREMYLEAMRLSVAGVSESDISGRISGIAYAKGRGLAFQMTCSIRGEILHNCRYRNTLKKGDLLLIDSGVESSLHYASDITRTLPVGGNFSLRQREIYSIVLSALNRVVEMLKPGEKYISCHLEAAKIIANGLKNLEIMRGNMDEAVAAGAHALFFPHGIGHLIGLDVHDMESLGEEHTGYNSRIKRSDQFGLSSLRFAKELKKNYTLTVEPGIYFIPELIRKWKAEKHLSEFINYNNAMEYIKFGGIRIEDDVLITDTGCRVLSRDIPKSIADLESQAG